MINFKDSNENKLSELLKKKGYLIVKLENLKPLEYLRNTVIKNTTKICNIKYPKNNEEEYFLNNFHKKIKSSKLNEYRVKIINSINKDINFKRNYFLSSKDILYNLVGNELSMQTRINLSIQTPKDKTSLLPHQIYLLDQNLTHLYHLP